MDKSKYLGSDNTRNTDRMDVISQESSFDTPSDCVENNPNR